MSEVTARARPRFDEGVGDADQSKVDERRSFLFLTVVMVPVLTVLIVAGYGFAVWMFQLIAGPPTA